MASIRRREREVVALAFNQKEQRVLEKSLATISLEASYSLKLLDLHNRAVKLHFRHVKDKVSRIKSHLTADEIHKLRQLEAAGRLHPMYTPVSLGSALKIAAAARRLHSSHPAARAKSALPRVNLPGPAPGPQCPGQTSDPQCADPAPLQRSNSVTGAFVDAPPPKADTRPGSADGSHYSAFARTPHSVKSSRSDVTGRGENTNGRGGENTNGRGENKGNGCRLRVGSAVSSCSSRPRSSELKSSCHLAPNSASTSSLDSSQLSKKSRSPQPRAESASTLPEAGNSKRPGTSASRPIAASPTPVSTAVQKKRPTTSTLQAREESPSSLSTAGRNKRPATSTSRPMAASPLPVSTSDGTKRPATSVSSRPLQSALSGSRRSSAFSRTSYGTVLHSRAPFSSHEAAEKEAREEGREDRVQLSSSAASHRDRKASISGGFNDDQVDDLGEDLQAERRAELLEEEQQRAADIERRKKRFLRDIDHYLEDHPPLQSLPITPQASPPEDTGPVEELDEDLIPLLRQRKVEFDMRPTHQPEGEYRERLMGLWRGMNRCRYLRVPESMLDLSGVNTLAADTMQLLQALRTRRLPALSTAWTE